MMGLAVLAGIAIYLGVFWLLVRALKTKRAKGAAILIALAIPFWDLPFGYYSFRDHCETEGGLQVLNKVQPQKKAFFDSLPPYPIKDLLTHGFTVVEAKDSGGNGISRYQLRADGGVEIRAVAQPESNVVVSVRRGQRLPWNIVRDDRFLRAPVEGKELARYSEFTWRGGWVQVVMSPLLGQGPSCTAGPTDPIVRLILRGGEPS
jgi:hypothetical protein